MAKNTCVMMLKPFAMPTAALLQITLDITEKLLGGGRPWPSRGLVDWCALLPACDTSVPIASTLFPLCPLVAGALELAAAGAATALHGRTGTGHQRRHSFRGSSVPMECPRGYRAHERTEARQPCDECWQANYDANRSRGTFVSRATSLTSSTQRCAARALQQ